jgi:hypothetical protein
MILHGHWLKLQWRNEYRFTFTLDRRGMQLLGCWSILRNAFLKWTSLWAIAAPTDFWSDVVPVAAPNLILESSLSRPPLFASYIAQLAPFRGIVGSYAPNNDLAFEWDQVRKALVPHELEILCGGNLLRLLNKRGPI